jgi:hypothetical protein
MPMNAQPASVDGDIEAAPEGARALLRSVVITDLCDSTALVDRLGDVRATKLIRAHDRLLRGLILEHRGQEIDKTDGFLSLFERPIPAVAFALAYQRGLRAFSRKHGVEVSARIGLHVGEVMTWQNEDADVAKGAKPTEVEGLERKAHRVVPLWRRATVLGFEAIARIVTVTLPAWHYQKPQPAVAFAERDWGCWPICAT